MDLSKEIKEVSHLQKIRIIPESLCFSWGLFTQGMWKNWQRQTNAKESYLLARCSNIASFIPVCLVIYDRKPLETEKEDSFR